MAMCDIAASLAPLAPSGYEMPLKADKDPEDCSMSTPRNRLKSDDAMTASPSTRSGSTVLESRTSLSPCSSEDPIQDDGSDGGDDAQDDYDAFLREMAGSFEAIYDDDEDDEESDSDDEEGSGSENDEPATHSSKENEEKVLNNSQMQEKSAIANKNTDTGTQKSPMLVPQSPLWQGSVAVRMPNGELKHRDERAPVEDSYEMVAMADPCEPPSLEMPPSAESQRSHLEDEIAIRQKQANSLLVMSRKEHLGQSVRDHYGKVGAELLAEIDALQKELDNLMS